MTEQEILEFVSGSPAENELDLYAVNDRPSNDITRYIPYDKTLYEIRLSKLKIDTRK